jgi:hypothetical protein
LLARDGRAKRFAGPVLIHVKAGWLDRTHDHYTTRQEPAMPISSAIIVSGIIVVFVAFGVILAWGDYQTRRVGH